jgi:hypothetical protein
MFSLWASFSFLGARPVSAHALLFISDRVFLFVGRDFSFVVKMLTRQPVLPPVER